MCQLRADVLPESAGAAAKMRQAIKGWQAQRSAALARRDHAVIIEPRKGLAATGAASARGEGAPVCKGRLVDIASIKQAKVIVRQAKMIAR